jgi:raffinose/stachyose/melibiose transport system permease protein
MRDSQLVVSTRYLIVLLLLAIYLFPLFYLFNVSMKTQFEYLKDPIAIAESLRPSNFLEAWEKGNFANYMWNSVLYTGVSTILSLIMSLIAAFPITRGYVKFSAFFYTFFLISLFLPNPLVPQFALMSELGLYNTQIGYILLRTSGTGIAFLLIAGYVKSISRELDEAAAMDGCGYFRYLFTILLPLTKPVLATGVILTAIGTWNDIITPVIYLSDPDLAPVTKGLFAFRGQYLNNWPLLACGIIIVAAPLIVLYSFLQKYIVDGALAGAVKA